ncbi:MAG: hypothetical protein HY261_01850 [Chloroflexi bacterium]|nr:hypothetical protein [Chloroflexota bacterium]
MKVQGEHSPRVLLVANDSYYLAWHLPRLFKAAGAHVTLMAPCKQPLRRSRFVDAFIEIVGTMPERLAAVEAHLATQEYDLITLTEEPMVEALANRSQRPRWMDWLEPDVARAISSRTEFATWAPTQGIPMAPGRVCQGPEEAAEWVRTHGASVLKCNHTRGGSGVRLVESPERMPEMWKDAGSPGEFLIQTYIHGPTGVTELVLRRGEIAAWFSSTKERQEVPFGASVMRRFADPPGMAAVVEVVAQATRFRGLSGFEWAQDAETGQLHLLEFIPRAPSGFRWGPYWGVDVPGAIADLFHTGTIEHRRPPLEQQASRAPLVCYFPDHLGFAVHRKRSDLRYWLPGSRAVAWRNAAFDDPGALTSLAWVLVSAAVRKRAQRARRLVGKVTRPLRRRRAPEHDRTEDSSIAPQDARDRG